MRNPAHDTAEEKACNSIPAPILDDVPATSEGQSEPAPLDVERLFRWALTSGHLNCSMVDEPDGTARWTHMAAEYARFTEEPT